MSALDVMMERAVLLDDAAKQLAQLDLDTWRGEDEGEDLLTVPAELEGLAEDPYVVEEGPSGLLTAVRRTSVVLPPQRRIMARKRITRAALLSYNHRGSIHYTRGSRRWGINERRWSSDGKYPRYVDCSAFATWLHRDATRLYGTRDFVNGYSWLAGYTGTMVLHGARISRPSLVGDCCFYGGTFSRPAHVAIYIGNGRVISHGQESGPLILRWNYRRVVQCRRYIR